MPRAAALATLALASACADTSVEPDASMSDAAPDGGPLPEPRADYGEPGAYPVGNRRVAMTDRSGERTLTVELWYPADASARDAATVGQALERFEAGTPHETTLTELVADASVACVRTQTRSADAPAAAATDHPLPLVVFSHCHACTRFAAAAVAERLASHGIVVAAPDHDGNTLWDALGGDVAPVGETFLRVRASDVSSVLDRMLAADASDVPEDLRGRLDPARVAVMGHSFGAATSGLVASTDERVTAGVAIAAPITALGGISLDAVRAPFLFLLAREDNSITELGNVLIRDEHRRLRSSVLVEVDDAGHWSFSDLAGLVPSFAAGCGEGTRQTVPDEAFTYLDPSLARELAADAAASFFAMHLLDDPGAATTLARMADVHGVAVRTHR